MYDLCFRSLMGLPLPARALTAFIIESILGRLLASGDVIVCSYVWMSNHVHMQIFSLDCHALTHFHERLKKRITDFLKRILGLSHLRLWDNRTTLGEVLDLEAAIERIGYAFLNPVRAGLVGSIDHYQGCNTWREFLSAPADVNAIVEKEVPEIFAADLSPLSHENPSLHEEHRFLIAIRRIARHRRTNRLRIMPFKWLEAFGIREPQRIEQIRQRIIAHVRLEEARLQAKPVKRRAIEGFIVTNRYIPKKRQRKVFMYATRPSLRLSFLAKYRDFVRRCTDCYRMLRQGIECIPWPPECFKPAAPRLCNSF